MTEEQKKDAETTAPNQDSGDEVKKDFKGLLGIFKEFGAFSRDLGHFQGIWSIFKGFKFVKSKKRLSP